MGAATIEVYDGGTVQDVDLQFVEVDSYLRPDVAGLFVNLDPDGVLWNVTHAPSGAAIVSTCCQSAALQALDDVAGLADWTRPTAELDLAALMAAVAQAITHGTLMGPLPDWQWCPTCRADLDYAPDEAGPC